MAAIGVATAMALSSCSTPASTPTATGALETPTQPTTITFWNGFTGPDGDALKARVDAFNKSQSMVTVDMTIMPWDVLGQKLLPALGAHQSPNIAVSGVESIRQEATAGAFASIDEFYNEWDQADQAAIFPDAIGTYDGHHWSVPMTWSPTLCYYNKTLFTDAGLDPNKPPVTWDEFAADAKAMTKDLSGDGKPDQYGFVLPDHTAPAIWEMLMWSNGGGTVSQDGTQVTIADQKSIDAVNYWSQLLIQDQISPAGISGPDADALFSSGKVGMLVEGPWMINGFKDAGLDFGVTGVPQGTAGSFAVANSNQFFISNDTMQDPNQKAAVWEFLKFWNSKDNQIQWSVTSGNPPTRSDITAADVAANPDMAAFLPFQATTRVFLPNQPSFGDTNTIYENAMQQITGGKGTPEAIMTDAAAAIQKLLDAAQ